jgi:hypothetical protein
MRDGAKAIGKTPDPTRQLQEEACMCPEIFSRLEDNIFSIVP